MPFQSEKQRRYLHANHPEIAKRWERDYGDGGVAKLNAQLNQLPEYYLPAAKGGIATHFKKRVKLQDSVESMSDEEFKIMYPDWDPTQFSQEDYLQYISENEGNGVLDLRTDDEAIEVASTEENEIIPDLLTPGSAAGILKLKDGGRIGFFTGAQADTASGKSMSPGTSASGGTRSGGDGGYQNVHQTGAVSQTPGRTTTGDRHPEVVVPKLPPQLSGKGTVTDAIDLAREDFETKKAQLEKKLRNTFIKKILGAFLGGGLTIGLSDLKTAKTMYDLSQIQKDYINLLENAKTQYKKQGLPEFNPHVDTAIQTLDQEILDLTQRPDKDEDTKGDGPPLTIDVLAETQEDIEEAPDMISMMDRIRAGQAKRAMLVQIGIIQDNPIVDESITDITMQANSGGLANLFRVKNQ